MVLTPTTFKPDFFPTKDLVEEQRLWTPDSSYTGLAAELEAGLFSPELELPPV